MASGVRPFTLDDIFSTRELPAQRGVALAPAGDLVACALRREGDVRVQDSPVPWNWAGCRLSVYDLDGRVRAALLPHAYAAWAPVWSPDGMRLAFLAADRAEDWAGLWVWERGTPSARRLDAPAPVPHDAPRWFPDGRRLCVGFLRPTRKRKAAMVPSVFRSPVQQSDAAAPWFDGWLGSVAVDGGEVEPLAVGVSAFAGMPAPQGGHLLAVAPPVQTDLARNRIALALYLHRADGWQGQVGTLTTGFGLGHWQPRWAPDGRHFAAVVDGTVTVWGLDRPQQPLRLRLPDGVRADGWVAFASDGGGLVAWAGGSGWWFPALRAGVPPTRLALPGDAGIVRRMDQDSLPGGDIRFLQGARLWRLRWGGDEHPQALLTVPGEVGGFRQDDAWESGDAASDGCSFLFIVQSERHAAIWRAQDDGRRASCLLDLNPHLRDVTWGDWHAFSYATADGTACTARILTPPGWKEGRPCPTIVGLYPNSPEPLLPVPPQLLAAHGYAVLWPQIPYDPHDARDPVDVWPGAVLPAIETAARQGFTDADRLAAVGQSHGGLAVLQLLTRTGRLRCAVADSAVTDLGALYGDMAGALDHPERAGQSVAWCETGPGGMGSPPWQRPERYVANSPVYHLDRIHTPLLLLAGDRDAGVPWSQAGEVYVGLTRLGRSCELAVYRGEGHTVMGWREANRRDAVTRILGWLHTHLRT